MHSLPLNEQKAEAPHRRDGGDLEVHSVFRTLQGEGPFAGEPAVFVRLSGCNLQCPRCDTDYTSAREVMSVARVVERVKFVGSEGGELPRLVVLTGGEPFRQNVGPLIDALTAADFRVQVETNGTLDVGAGEDELSPYVTVVVSPKTAHVHPSVQARADWWKYVLSHDAVSDEDGLPTSSLGMPRPPARPPRYALWQGGVIVQPCDSGDPETNEKNLQACVRSCLKYGYRLGVQLHKTAKLP